MRVKYFFCNVAIPSPQHESLKKGFYCLDDSPKRVFYCLKTCLLLTINDKQHSLTSVGEDEE